jgi:hypothetical protein
MYIPLYSILRNVSKPQNVEKAAKRGSKGARPRSGARRGQGREAGRCSCMHVHFWSDVSILSLLVVGLAGACLKTLKSPFSNEPKSTFLIYAHVLKRFNRG